MANIMHWLVPKEAKFFEMLAEQSQNALEGAGLLKEFVNEYADISKSQRKSKANEIKHLESKGDEITHKIMEKLNTTFITPIDKEDIHHMAVLLDDIIDLINAVASRFVILSIERIDDYITKFADLIHKAVNEVNRSIIALRNLKDMKEHYIKIHSIENEADELYQNALSDLFHYYKNSIDIIKYKELYEILERVTDKCEDISHVTEGVVVKHA